MSDKINNGNVKKGNGLYNFMKNMGVFFNRYIKNNKRVKIIILLVIAVIVLLLVFGIKRIINDDNSSNNNYVSSLNEPINIIENNDDVMRKYDISIVVTAVDENQEIVKGRKHTRLKVAIKNNGENNISLGLIQFYLLNSNDNVMGMTTVISNYMYSSKYNVDEKILLLENHLEKKQITSGYLYFETSSNDINKLKIQVPASNEKGYQSYYINLK